MATLLCRTGRQHYACLTAFQPPLQRSHCRAAVLVRPIPCLRNIAAARSQSFLVSASRVDIISPYNDHVKHYSKLRTSRQYRDICGRVILVGGDLLQEVASYKRPEGCVHVHSMLVRQRTEPPSGIKADRVSVVTDDIIDKISGLRNTDGVQAVAEVDMPKSVNLSEANGKQLQRLLVLEGLQDPGNLGTLLRTAVALGWEACFLLPGCCDPFNDKALKAGRGAAFKLPIAEGNWGELRRVLRRHDMQCYGASPHTHDTSASAQQLQQQNAPVTQQTSDVPNVTQARTEDQSQDDVIGSRAMCIVLGSEGQGLSETALEHSTPLAIPMAGPMESLNVSQAGAILMYAFGGNTSLLYQQAQTPQRTS